MPDKIGEMITLYGLEKGTNRFWNPSRKKEEQGTQHGLIPYGQWILKEAERIRKKNRVVEIIHDDDKIGLKVDCVAVDVSNVLRRNGTLQPGAKVKEPFYITLPPKVVEEEE